MNPRIALLLIALAAPVMSGSLCVNTSTHVEKGDLYTTGDATYDAFFKDMRDVHTEAFRAELEQGEAQKSLATALGLDASINVKDAVAAAQERAKKLSDRGVRIHLVLTPEPKLVTARGAAIDAEVEGMRKGVEESARLAIALSRRLGGMPDRIAMLERTRTELRARSMEAFRAEPEVRRNEIVQELDASKQVLREAAEFGAKQAGRASQFLIELAQAVETGGGAGAAASVNGSGSAPSAAAPPVAPPPVPQQPPTAPTRRWKGPPAGAKPPTPPAPPKPKPPQGDDFDP